MSTQDHRWTEETESLVRSYMGDEDWRVHDLLATLADRGLLVPLGSQPALIPVVPQGSDSWTEYGVERKDEWSTWIVTGDDYPWVDPAAADVNDGDRLMERTIFVGPWREIGARQ